MKPLPALMIGEANSDEIQAPIAVCDDDVRLRAAVVRFSEFRHRKAKLIGHPERISKESKAGKSRGNRHWAERSKALVKQDLEVIGGPATIRREAKALRDLTGLHQGGHLIIDRGADQVASKLQSGRFLEEGDRFKNLVDSPIGCSKGVGQAALIFDRKNPVDEGLIHCGLSRHRQIRVGLWIVN